MKSPPPPFFFCLCLVRSWSRAAVGGSRLPPSLFAFNNCSLRWSPHKQAFSRREEGRTFRFLCSRAWCSVRASACVLSPSVFICLSLGGLLFVMIRRRGGWGGVGWGGFHMKRSEKRTIQSRCMHNKRINNAERRLTQSALKLFQWHIAHTVFFFPVPLDDC